MKTIDKVRKKVYLDSKQLVHIFGNILMVIGAIIVLINQSERTYSFYWLALGLSLLGSVYFLDQYGKDGKTQVRKADNNWNTKISGQAQDKMMFVMIIGVLMVCSIFVLEFFYQDITRNISSVIYSLIVMIIYQIVIIYLSKALYKEIIATEKSINQSRLKK